MDAEKDCKPAQVLLGSSGGVGSLGLRDSLIAEGFEIDVNGSSLDEVLERLDDEEPDAVVLDMELDDAAGWATRIAAEHPAVKVIVCSLDEPRMRVFLPWGGGAYEAPLDPDRLATAVRSAE